MRTVAFRRLAVSVVGCLQDFGRFGRLSMPSGEGRPAVARRSWRSVVAGTVRSAVLASGVCAAGAQSAFCADGPAFAFRPLLAGRASLMETGFVETRTLGTANFASELRMPVELVYRSASEESGMFGYGWSSSSDSFNTIPRDCNSGRSCWRRSLYFRISGVARWCNNWR